MPKQLKFWNLMKNEKDNSAEMILYGSIGSDEEWDDISDKAFKQDIENLGDVENITLHINSPGGSVFSAVAIANTLKNHKAKVTANIDGLAASAATIITSACDTVRMPKNAMFMIHNPITLAYGDNQDMKKTLEMLDKVKDSIIETYVGKVAIDKAKLSELMDNESWLTAQEAKEYGFIDEIIDEEVQKEVVENKLIINSMAFDISKFKNFKNRKVSNMPANNNKNISKNEENKEVKMTVDELKNQFPDLYSYVINEGKELGKTEERERLKAIDEMDISNYPELVENAKYTNPVQASDLAMDILKRQKEEKAQKLKNIQKESQDHFTPPMPNNGVAENKEEKQFMGVNIINILKGMNNKIKEVQ